MLYFLSFFCFNINFILDNRSISKISNLIINIKELNILYIMISVIQAKEKLKTDQLF